MPATERQRGSRRDDAAGELAQGPLGDIDHGGSRAPLQLDEKPAQGRRHLRGTPSDLVPVGIGERHNRGVGHDRQRAHRAAPIAA